jgi:hypothetical protein
VGLLFKETELFRYMFHVMHYQGTYYRDTHDLPPGKVLEIVTIDAARAGKVGVKVNLVSQTKSVWLKKAMDGKCDA